MSAMQMMGLASDDMLDEWEWPEDCTAQRELERHLRCQICGDFFHGPVLLPCSHTFCSACVRRFLQSKGAQGCCPQCKQPCASRDLVSNRALEQVTLQFKKAKPELLKRLLGTSEPSSTPNTERGKRHAKQTKQDKPERMPLMSYSVMRDKEVRKLLNSINVRVPTKNREEIIQIHKEADSVDPKSKTQLREEVVRNHYARMQQKAKPDVFKLNNTGSENAGSGNAASPASGVSVQMRANFEKLRQDIADRKAGKRPPTPATDSSSTSTPAKAQKTPAEVGDAASVGVWRHFCALDTSVKQEFYVNSLTHEIRVELPSPLVQEQSPANRYDDLGGVARAVAERESAGAGRDSTAKMVTPSKAKAKAKRAIAPAFASPDATSEFQSATEEIVVSDNEGEEGEEKEEMATGTRKRESLGKRARSNDGTDSTADDSIDASAEDAGNEGGEATEWQCSRCTLINEATCQQCEACGYELTSAPAKRLRKKMHFQSKISLS